MGNKASRRKPASADAPVKRRKKGQGHDKTNGHKDKHISCPDLGGATPYRLYDEEPKIKYNIYRSYRDLDNNKIKREPEYDIKVYRRSTAGSPPASPTFRRPNTLPRGFGRSKSAMLPARVHDVTTPNGGIYMDWERATGAPTPDSEYGYATMRSGRSSRLSRGSKRSSIASSSATSINEIWGSSSVWDGDQPLLVGRGEPGICVHSWLSKCQHPVPNNSVPQSHVEAQVAASDFPSTDTIKRKLTYFEEHFARCLVQKYRLLPESDQLASLALAMRKRFGQSQTVTLLQYMEGETVPSDLLSPMEKFVLLIPQALFHGIAHVRQDKNKDMKLWTSLAADVVMCIGIEAANELSRMYEYQIALMFDDASIRILANHAAECAVDYVRNNTYMDRNAAIQGVVKNIPPNPDGLPKYLAVVLGDKEMKWELYDIFKKCGLRKELSLVSDELIVDPDEDSLDVDPWTFHFANGIDPMIYGYRGQLIEWDFNNKVYKLDSEDEEKFAEEMFWRPDDFHRMYRPYRRLVGTKVMQSYTKLQQEGESKRTLPDLLRSDFDEVEERDEIQPVYRPLVVPEDSALIKFSNVNLNNVDLARVQMKNADVTGSSAENAKFLLADAADVKASGGWNMKGADISFSTVGECLSPQQAEGVRGRSVVVMTSSPLQQQPAMPNGHSLTNGFQETDLDESLPSEIGESPIRVVVSDEHGNIIPVNQIIENKKAAVVREERERAAARDAVDSSLSSGLPSPDSLSSPGSGAGVTPINHDRLRAEKKKRRRAKQRRTPSQEDNPLLNSSIASNNTDISFQEVDRQVRNPPLQRASAVEYDQAAPVYHQGRSSSSSSVTFDNHQVPEIHRNGHVSEEDIRPASAAAVQSGVVLRGSDSPKSRSASASNIHRETYHGQALHDTSLPPMRGTRVTSTLPRMVKSVSHHGGSWKTASIDYRDSHNLGFVPLGTRQAASEVEYIRRSQIFNIMKGLQIRNLEDNLPDNTPIFLGRDQEVADIVDLLSSSGRIITLVGGAGVGKSSIANATAVEMKSKYVSPVYFDCRGCKTTESVWLIINQTFSLHMKMEEILFLSQWVNSHEQRLLFLFDNLELPVEESAKMSELLDKLVTYIKNVRVMCTSSRNFFRGQASQETYRVGDVRQEADKILSTMVPDLHEEGLHQLASAADNVLLGLVICGRSFSIEDVDSGKLFEDLTSPEPNGLPLAKLEDVLSEFTVDEMEKQKLSRVASCVRTILDYFQPEVRELLAKLSCSSSFSVETAASLSGMAVDQAHEVLRELVNCNMLIAVTKNGGRFFIPSVVKVVLDTCWPDDGTKAHSFVKFFVQKIKDLCTVYHSKNCFDALETVIAEYDNIVDSLNRVLEREDTYDLCSEFASPEFAMFLYEILPRQLYEDLYDSLVQQCEEQGATVAQAFSLCCSSYLHMKKNETEAAKICAERAYSIVQGQQSIKEVERAFCLQCLGRIYFMDPDTKEKGVVLLKRALDIFKIGLGVRHLRTLYANEDYGYMLTDKGTFQTARHFYNISDFIVRELLDIHPLLLEGYNCRRVIWDKLCLFARTIEVAQKAVDTAQLYLGDHPRTAEVLAQLCDAVMRRGSLNDALHTAIKALTIRTKVLGDHVDTATSYKTVAYLMSRSGQYDEACRFAQSAMDIYDKVEAPERLKVEVKNLIAQSRFKLDCKSTKFVELESKDASKKNIADDLNSTGGISTISTEV